MTSGENMRESEVNLHKATSSPESPSNVSPASKNKFVLYKIALNKQLISQEFLYDQFIVEKTEYLFILHVNNRFYSYECRKVLTALQL